MEVKQSIDKKSLAFTITFLHDEKAYTLYVPCPSIERADAAAPILGSLFSLKETSSLSPLVLSRDYANYAKRACRKIAMEESKTEREVEKESDRLFNLFKGFIESSILAATVITPDHKTLKLTEISIPEQTLETATGMYVFFYTNWRYAWMALNEQERKGMITYLSITDFIKHSQTL